MSAAPKQAKAKGPDGATPVGTMRLTGVIRTTRGYAVAQETVDADGARSLVIGPSQAFPEHVASEHKRVVVNATLKAQAGK